MEPPAYGLCLGARCSSGEHPLRCCQSPLLGTRLQRDNASGRTLCPTKDSGGEDSAGSSEVPGEGDENIPTRPHPIDQGIHNPIQAGLQDRTGRRESKGDPSAFTLRDESAICSADASCTKKFQWNGSWTGSCDPMWQLRKGVPSWIDEYHPQATQGKGGMAMPLRCGIFCKDGVRSPKTKNHIHGNL